MAAAVQQAREAGRTWQEVGEVLGVSRQAVFQRYGKSIGPRTGETVTNKPTSWGGRAGEDGNR